MTMFVIPPRLKAPQRVGNIGPHHARDRDLGVKKQQNGSLQVADKAALSFGATAFPCDAKSTNSACGNSSLAAAARFRYAASAGRTRFAISVPRSRSTMEMSY